MQKVYEKICGERQRKKENKREDNNTVDGNEAFYLLRLYVFLYMVLLPVLDEVPLPNLDVLCRSHLKRNWKASKQDLLVLVRSLELNNTREFYAQLDQSYLMFFDNETFIVKHLDALEQLYGRVGTEEEENAVMGRAQVRHLLANAGKPVAKKRMRKPKPIKPDGDDIAVIVEQMGAADDFSGAEEPSTMGKPVPKKREQMPTSPIPTEEGACVAAGDPEAAEYSDSNETWVLVAPAASVPEAERNSSRPHDELEAADDSDGTETVVRVREPVRRVPVGSKRGTAGEECATKRRKTVSRSMTEEGHDAVENASRKPVAQVIVNVSVVHQPSRHDTTTTRHARASNLPSQITKVRQ